jgi:phage-related protein
MFYTEGNRCFAGDFIFGLSEKELGKVKYYLELLESRGPMLREPYAKKLNGNIYELRPGFGKTEIRLFYFWDGNTAWFVHGIIKKTQKTPAEALRISGERMTRYFKAKAGR